MTAKGRPRRRYVIDNECRIDASVSEHMYGTISVLAARCNMSIREVVRDMLEHAIESGYETLRVQEYEYAEGEERPPGGSAHRTAEEERNSARKHSTPAAGGKGGQE
jgi:hypothetical protein